jgi:hypothetical protein
MVFKSNKESKRLNFLFYTLRKNLIESEDYVNKRYTGKD